MILKQNIYFMFTQSNAHLLSKIQTPCNILPEVWFSVM